MPFNPYNALSLIANLFPQDSSSQTQSQESPVKTPPDARRRIELTSLVEHIAKGVRNMSEEDRAYCRTILALTSRTYDVSKHPTLVKNQNKMPWSEVSSRLLTYLENTRDLFERSEIWINPERRINGLKVDDRMIQAV
jgi:hypothetical protein